MTAIGILLAAGAGRRYGLPKALVDDWLARTVATLREGGCASVIVVIGASADEVAARLPDGVDAVRAERWASGMGASLSAGLTRALDGEATSAVVHLVDLPDVGPQVIDRLLQSDAGPNVLARAVYRDRPGHPVLLGRHHWEPIKNRAQGDAGARNYLRTHAWTPIECGDLATGRDVDFPPN